MILMQGDQGSNPTRREIAGETGFTHRQTGLSLFSLCGLSTRSGKMGLLGDSRSCDSVLATAALSTGLNTEGEAGQQRGGGWEGLSALVGVAAPPSGLPASLT